MEGKEGLEMAERMLLEERISELSNLIGEYERKSQADADTILHLTRQNEHLQTIQVDEKIKVYQQENQVYFLSFSFFHFSLLIFSFSFFPLSFRSFLFFLFYFILFYFIL